ncbi:toxin-antitoxin system YwqK family antitoxin [Helicobacter bilis]|uniref:toxin-antitoxin system YwqK family antitoxin n=1 Tax=Helicobacter bilis TaxID=37372 RepID=UPI00248D6666|nr:toxin-antitoxin system YwqK family antitoxin [Helicobacter bilis]
MFLKSVFIGFLSFHSVDTTMLKECENHADKISGCVEREYHSNGKLMRETPYKNGKIEGIEKWYDESGNLASEIPHKNDEAHGNLKYYTEDGKLLALLKAENDKIIDGKCSNNKAPTNKDLEEIGRFYNAGKAINYLKEVCLNP